MVMHKKTRTVSLVLGSGGARGLAHIGVIQWLEEHGYEIKSIAGSSIGALIGGIYAAGKLEGYTQWVKALSKHDVLQLLDFAFNISGIFSGDRVMQELRDLLGDVQIQELPISFTAVATDLDAGREVWLNKGSLFDAIRASIAIPTIFTPVAYKGRLLVDGGLLNPVPIAPTMDDLTDSTIAVSLSGKEEVLPKRIVIPKQTIRQPDHSRYQTAIREFVDGVQRHLATKKTPQEDAVNMFDILSRSLDAMQNTIARFKLAAYNPDCLLEIPVNLCGMFEFYRAEESIAFGYARAEHVLGKKGSE